MKETVQKIFESIESLSLVDFMELQKMLQNSWGVSDNDLTSAPTSVPQQVVEEVEEDANYNLVAVKMQDSTKQVKCIIFLKNTFTMEMKKAKEILENLSEKPVVRSNVSKEDAEKLIKEAAHQDVQLVLERVKA